MSGVRWAVLAGSVLVLSGCLPGIPLDESPKVDLDKHLLGRWNCASPDSGEPEPMRLVFGEMPDRPREYRIAAQGDEDADDGEPFEGAFISEVRGKRFLNVPTSARRDEWAFVHYSLLRENVLYLEMPDDDLDEAERHAESPAHARKILESAMDERDPLEPFTVCLRLEDEEEQK